MDSVQGLYVHLILIIVQFIKFIFWHYRSIQKKSQEEKCYVITKVISETSSTRKPKKFSHSLNMPCSFMLSCLLIVFSPPSVEIWFMFLASDWVLPVVINLPRAGIMKQLFFLYFWAIFTYISHILLCIFRIVLGSRSDSHFINYEWIGCKNIMYFQVCFTYNTYTRLYCMNNIKYNSKKRNTYSSFYIIK